MSAFHQTSHDDQDRPPAYQRTSTVTKKPHSHFTVPMIPTLDTHYGYLNIHNSARLKFINIPCNVISNVQEAIERVWRQSSIGKPIRDTRLSGISFEMKMRGAPWSCSCPSDVVRSMRLLATALQALYNQGWVVDSAVNFSWARKDKGKKSTFSENTMRCRGFFVPLDPAPALIHRS